MKERRKQRLPNPVVFRRAVSSQDYLRPQRWNWSVLSKPLDSRLQTGSEGTLGQGQIGALRNFWLDGIFSTLGENFFIGFAVMFALAYGATSTQIGYLTAVANLLGAAAFYPGALLGKKRERQKLIVIASGGGLGRLSVLLMALIPWLTPDPAVAVILIIILNASKSFWGNLGNPSWTSIVADIVPSHYRGRYFSSRNFAMGVAALCAAPAAGKLIRSVNTSGHSEFAGYQAAFFCAFVLGMLGTFFFSRIDIDHPDNVRAKGLDGKGNGPADRSLFLWFVISSFIWSMSIQIAGPFFNVYLARELGGDISFVGYSAGISSLSALVGQLVFGKILTKHGSIKVQILSGVFIPFIPILWVFFTQPWHVFFGSILGGFMWAGYNLTNFNILLDLTNGKNRARDVAVFQGLMFVSAVIGPALGGLIINYIQYKAIFIASGIGRMAGLLIFIPTVALPLIRKGKEGAV